MSWSIILDVFSIYFSTLAYNIFHYLYIRILCCIVSWSFITIILGINISTIAYYLFYNMRVIILSC